MFSLTTIPSTSSVLSVYTSFAASAMLVRTVVNEVQNLTNQILPRQLQDGILSKLGFLVGNLSSEMSIIVDEYNGYALNQMFEAAEVYLRTKQSSPSVDKVKVYKAPREKKLTVSMNKGEKIVDSSFQGMVFVWELVIVETQKTNFDYEGSFSSQNVEHRSFHLSFNKKFKDTALNAYLPYVMERSKSIQEENKNVKIYSLGNMSGEYEGVWGSINLEHPSTFETLAMDPEVKKNLMDDLDRFVRRRDFYKRVGKAWKRGYLLYGPPGTGKSSLIAAMANHLKFDIYDLELTSLQSNSELRTLLVSTKNRSILVIEDIDCTIDLENRQSGGYAYSDNQITLSGLLNFIDGLWSSCGDERIIVFTTNYKDKLDPALLRPGRMDKHIHMSYCTPNGFKILASRYLGKLQETQYRLYSSQFIEIEKLISQVNVTPAEVAEQLMVGDSEEDPHTALLGLIAFLETKQKQEQIDEESKTKAKEGEDEEIIKKKEVEIEGKAPVKKLRRSKRKRTKKCRRI